MNSSSITQTRFIWTLAALLVINTVVPTGAASAQITTFNHPLSWITLGTQGGPILNAQRSQPANLLVVNGKPWLVDCGDGALERLVAAGYEPLQVNTVFISHLHMDHIGGLQGLIGLRWFGTGKHTLLTIYGPPGTDVVVAGIMESLKPSVEIGMGVALAVPGPEELTKVVVIRDGSDLSVDGVRIRAARNSHFDDPPGHPADDGSQTLSYRFDYKDYGIGYTGDTGPSDAVAHLEKGVNLLVSEVIDLQAAIAMIHDSKMSAQAEQAMIEHFSTQHITPKEAGKIATLAGAQRLVFTHLSISGTTEANAPNLIREAHKSFKGEVLVAHDLDSS
jgi:ribonuclease BN (tRNA processing enzyme)